MFVAYTGYGRIAILGVPPLVTAGAATAMAGVLLNLLLGLSRVLLAMARRRDAPAALARVSTADSSPRNAVVVIGVLISCIVLIGSVRMAWSFSAFTVLVYYALTNLAALRQPADQRRYPRWVAGAGLLSCLGLAFWVDPVIWLVGLGVIGLGLVWRLMMRKLAAAG